MTSDLPPDANRADRLAKLRRLGGRLLLAGLLCWAVGGWLACTAWRDYRQGATSRGLQDARAGNRGLRVSRDQEPFEFAWQLGRLALVACLALATGTWLVFTSAGGLLASARPLRRTEANSEDA
jgi:hypothetical protein